MGKHDFFRFSSLKLTVAVVIVFAPLFLHMQPFYLGYFPHLVSLLFNGWTFVGTPALIFSLAVDLFVAYIFSCVLIAIYNRWCGYRKIRETKNR